MLCMDWLSGLMLPSLALSECTLGREGGRGDWCPCCELVVLSAGEQFVYPQPHSNHSHTGTRLAGLL